MAPEPDVMKGFGAVRFNIRTDIPEMRAFEDAVTVTDHRLHGVTKVECFAFGEGVTCDIHRGSSVETLRTPLFNRAPPSWAFGVKLRLPGSQVDFQVGAFRPVRPATCVFVRNGSPISESDALRALVEEGQPNVSLLCREGSGKSK